MELGNDLNAALGASRPSELALPLPAPLRVCLRTSYHAVFIQVRRGSWTVALWMELWDTELCM